MIIKRTWAMPNSETFKCKPIGELVSRYLSKSKISIDPFARNSDLCTYTNDMNKDTNAKYHMDALEFLEKVKDDGIVADLVLLDPPYSLRQMKEVYNGVGRKITQRESQRFYGDLRDAVDKVVSKDGVVIWFGWNSIGMGKGRGYKIVEILLVCHGRAHNDTIVTVDIRG
jgi:hypothetical protein